MSSSFSCTHSCVSVSVSNNIQKRFYPGFNKPLIGHAHKILNSLVNKMPNVSRDTWTGYNKLTTLFSPKNNIQYHYPIYYDKYGNIKIHYVTQNERIKYFESSAKITSKTILAQKKIICDKNLSCSNNDDAALFHKLTLNSYGKPFSIKGLSGIYCAPPSFYIDSLSNLKICQLTLKFIINVFGTKPLSHPNDVALLLEKFLMISNKFEYPDYYPLAQHITSSVLALYKFSPTLLYEITGTMIDYKFYMNSTIGPLPIIESILYKATLTNFFTQYKDILHIIAQNPDNPLSDHTKYADIAYILLKQPNPDLRMEIISPLSLIKEPKKILFFDGKMKSEPLKTTPSLKGFLSFTTKMDQEFLIKRFKADLGNKIKFVTDFKQKLLLEEEKNKIIKLLANKTLTIEEKFMEFKIIQDKIDVNLELPLTMACSRIVIMSVDVNFDKFYTENPHIEQELIEIAKNIDLELLVPKQTQKAHIIVWKKLIVEIVNKLPSDIKPLIIDNMHKYLTWEL